MKIVIVTDSWEPLVNGVVKTLQNTRRELSRQGHHVSVISPNAFRTIPCPSYPEIRLAVFPYRGVARKLRELRPDSIHIATEGPLGHAARRYCIRKKLRFTTSWHTQFPEYIRLRYPVPLSISYAYLRRFHAAASHTMVTTPSIRTQLFSRGFRSLQIWPRGVNAKLFHPGYPRMLKQPHPVLLYMGRVAVEKNIEAFLKMKIPGSKVVIGDGPQLEELKERYPDAAFLGKKKGEDLASHVASADVFVFPSITDTFGLVLLEAMACGVPVAAFPVQGPQDVIKQGVTGYMDKNLSVAIKKALRLDRDECARYAANFTWKKCTDTFESYLVTNDSGHSAANRQTAFTLGSDSVY